MQHCTFLNSKPHLKSAFRRLPHNGALDMCDETELGTPQNSCSNICECLPYILVQTTSKSVQFLLRYLEFTFGLIH